MAQYGYFTSLQQPPYHGNCTELYTVRWSTKIWLTYRNEEATWGKFNVQKWLFCIAVLHRPEVLASQANIPIQLKPPWKCTLLDSKLISRVKLKVCMQHCIKLWCCYSASSVLKPLSTLWLCLSNFLQFITHTRSNYSNNLLCHLYVAICKKSFSRLAGS